MSADEQVAVLPALLPTPTVFPSQVEEALPSVFFGIRVEAAVNLLEAREYAGLPRTERLGKALAEQRGFLNGLLDPHLLLAVDLRVLVRPDRSPPIEIAVLGRHWSTNGRTAPVGSLCDRIRASMPPHVSVARLDTPDATRAFLAPFPPDLPVESALITRRELTALPTRPDAKMPYYFSVVPFNWVESDWTALYAALSESPVPLVLSVGLLPGTMSSELGYWLTFWSSLYDRLAREDEQAGGLYYGPQKLAPDAFAVDAHHIFRDYARRYRTRAFHMRIQVAAPGRLPPGLVEQIAATISPTETALGSHLDRNRAAASYEIRRPTSGVEQQIARWNLEQIDFRLTPGDPSIWARPDPPASELQVLSLLADARDANCAFRLPIAVDGTVPGFKVRRGQFGHVERYGTDQAALRIGDLPDGAGPIQLPLTSLTKHALVAGGTGSGKTTTVLGLLRQLWLDHRVPFLVIEPVNAEANDYRKLAAEPGFEDLDVYTVGDDGVRPLRFNPFEVPAGVLVGEHTANLLACFKAAFGLWEPLPSIYQDALNLSYLRAGILSSERADGSARPWPTAVEFAGAMQEVTAGLGYAGEVRANIEAASLRRARQLATGPSASVFLTNQPNDIAGLLDHPVVLELKSLGTGDEQALMIALLLTAVTEHYQAVRGASDRLEHVTVIEEAHRLLARPTGGKDAAEAQAREKAAEAFANTLAENRKYGEGVLVAEQLPTKLVQDAVKNTNLKIMHRLTAEDDIRYVGATMGFDDAQMRFATRLQTGEALAYSDEYAEATLIKIPPPAARSPGPVPTMSAPPFSACQPCRSPCLYRGAALAIVREPAVAKQLKEAVIALEQPALPSAEVTKRWTQLVNLLRSRVRFFPALPAEEPGLSDAAYCLFLHSLAIRSMRFAPAWPTAVAKRLGLSKPPAAGSR